MKKEREMNNKGFSLVELIIVIAIMVILVAVLAPQYLKYVEKSRVSTDTQTMVEFINAMQVLVADPDTDLTGGAYSVVGEANGLITVSADLQTKLIDAQILSANDFRTVGGNVVSANELQSQAFKTANVQVELVYDNAKQIWSLKTTNIDSSGKLPTPANP